jgi:hypothetical protein
VVEPISKKRENSPVEKEKGEPAAPNFILKSTGER